MYLLVDIAMAVFPPLASVPQLMVLRENKNIGSFSIYVPAILLIANIMRIFFWISVGFAFNLLIQSILMIIMQVEMILGSLFCWRNVWKYLTTRSRIQHIGNNSGNGKPMPNTVNVNLCSQISIGTDSSDDSCHNDHPALHFRLFRTNDRACFLVHRSNSWFSSGVFQLCQQECGRLECTDDSDVVFGRFLQNCLLYRQGKKCK